MKVLIYIAWFGVKAWNIPERQVAKLRERFPEIDFLHESTEAGVFQSIPDVEVSFSSRLTPAMVEHAKKLRWVHSSAAAVEGLLPLRELAEHGILLTNSRGVQAVPIAEQVMAGLLVLARRTDLTLAAQREKRWIQAELCDTGWPWMLYGRSMTIVGLGTIGTEVARRAAAFGIRVAGVRGNPGRDKPAFVDRVVGPDRLHDVLAGCDILVIAAPFVSGTRRMIGDEELRLLNPGAVLVNVARGQIVDEASMIDALGSGRLGGAVLDVFDREPLEPSSPLWSLPNVVISPHSAGFRKSHWDDVTGLFTENLRRYQRGETLINRCDARAGY